MKQKKMLVSLALTLMLLFSFSLTISAQAALNEEAAIVQLDDMRASDPAESNSPDTQEEAPAQPVDPDAEEMPTPPVPNKGNTPYFIGAGIAVFVFAGVAFYCNARGNKTF